MSNPEALIGFDLDKTLIRSASWYRLNLAMGMTPEEDEALYRRGPEKDGELTYSEWMNELAARYRKYGKANKEAVEDILLDYTMLDGAKEAVAKLHGEGYILAIVTGGFETVAQDVARKLGIEIVHANVKLEFAAEGAFQGIKLDSADDRSFKADVMKGLEAKHAIDGSRTFYVADGDNDQEVFNVTRGIQITPELSSHEPWKATALAQGETFALHDAKKAAEFELTSIRGLPELLENIHS
jgi:phosphoserine phosphatase